VIGAGFDFGDDSLVRGTRATEACRIFTKLRPDSINFVLNVTGSDSRLATRTPRIAESLNRL